MELKSTRDAYGEVLLKLGDNDRVVVLDADLSTSTQTNKFQRNTRSGSSMSVAPSKI